VIGVVIGDQRLSAIAVAVIDAGRPEAKEHDARDTYREIFEAHANDAAHYGPAPISGLGGGLGTREARSKTIPPPEKQTGRRVFVLGAKKIKAVRKLKQDGEQTP
jgi:hypothetical protein